MNWVGLCSCFKGIKGTVEVGRSRCTDKVDLNRLERGGSGGFVHAGPEAYVVAKAIKGREGPSNICVGEVGTELIMKGFAECPSGRAGGAMKVPGGDDANNKAPCRFTVGVACWEQRAHDRS